MVQKELGRYEEAIRDLSQAIRLEPDWIEALFQRGEAYNLWGRPEQAASDFSAILAVKPRDASTHFQRGLCLLRLNVGCLP